jgi:hypothetical protein
MDLRNLHSPTNDYSVTESQAGDTSRYGYRYVGGKPSASGGGGVSFGGDTGSATGGPDISPAIAGADEVLDARTGRATPLDMMRDRGDQDSAPEGADESAAASTPSTAGDVASAAAESL